MLDANNAASSGSERSNWMLLALPLPGRGRWEGEAETHNYII